MGRIRVLAQEIANQIAAGEVVERPASVVKELLENAIDAGAGKIAVEVEMGGRRLIKVTDDGEGMARSDAKLAFVRHATSKISNLNDLESIATLGFRGEALASIASVSRIGLITKRESEESATHLTRGRDGKFEITDTAHPTGTTVEICDLFYNTPARRKFLRSQPTENFHIAAIVTNYSLANPSIGFSLTNNGRESLRVAPANTLRERAYQLFGNDMIESLIPVVGEDRGFVEVTGFVSAPRERRTSRDSQYLFINNRYVKDRVVSAGISDAYRSVLPHGVFPVAILFLQMPPAEVDVNVHPSKTEVRFRRAEAVKEAVSQSIRTALSGAGIGQPERKHSSVAPFEDLVTKPKLAESGEEVFISRAAGANVGSGEVTLDFPNDLPSSKNAPRDRRYEDRQNRPVTSPLEKQSLGYANLPPIDSAASVPFEVAASTLDSKRISIVGQLHNSFMIASDDEGLLLIDQHVAHERILFDKFRQREYSRRIESQNLLIPETIEMTPAQAERINELAPRLTEFGFRVSVFSGRTIAVKSAPSDLPPGEIRNLISELLETAETENMRGAEDAIRDSIAATLACKAAVKINMKLSDEKMRWMVDRLLLTTSPTTCPHGRPVVLRLTMKDIERRFHRT